MCLGRLQLATYREKVEAKRVETGNDRGQALRLPLTKGGLVVGKSSDAGPHLLVGSAESPVVASRAGGVSTTKSKTQEEEEEA